MERDTSTSLPFGSGRVTADFAGSPVSVLAPTPWATTGRSAGAQIRAALEHPRAGPRLCDLAGAASSLVVITSDHTRSLPSRITLPLLFAEARRHRADLPITLIIGTGLHRRPSQDEIEERFGRDVLSSCVLAIHDASCARELVDLGTLSTGNHLLVNRLVAEADLLVAEGLIEPHFFAGYSGGRKSVLPAVAAPDSIYYNHRPEYIDHPRARNGVLEGNPIHEESLEAARRARLRFILNVVVTSAGDLVAAVAGEADAAHRAGADEVAAHATVRAVPADIVVVSNFGYPLDRDLYQGVKGLSVASDAAKPGGTIILVAECRDGVGHKEFLRLASMPEGPGAILRAIRERSVPARDAWQAQILARILMNHHVIVMSPRLDPHDMRLMHLDWAPDLPAALARARTRQGKDASIAVIPEGPATIIATAGASLPV